MRTDTAAQHRPWLLLGLPSVVVFNAQMVIACVLTAAAGCGPERPSTGTVRGAVTAHGEKLTTGLVCLVSKAGVGAVAAVAADGTYSFGDPLPVGEYTVWLEPPERIPPGPGNSPSYRPDDSQWRRLVPSDYRTQSSSPLRCVVQPTSNMFPIEIAD